MIGLRNVLVHAYSRVDPPLEVWAVVDQDIPPALEEEVVALLSLLGGTEGAG